MDSFKGSEWWCDGEQIQLTLDRARKMTTRTFEPKNWSQVRKLLIGIAMTQARRSRPSTPFTARNCDGG
jgi:hypothetical protein